MCKKQIPLFSIAKNANEQISHVAWTQIQSFTTPQSHHVAGCGAKKKRIKVKNKVNFFQSMVRFFNQSRRYDAADENN